MRKSRKVLLDESRTELMLNVEHVAARLGVTTRTVWRMVERGFAPAPVKIGGSTKWDRPALEAWLAAGCPKTEPVTAGANS